MWIFDTKHDQQQAAAELARWKVIDGKDLNGPPTFSVRSTRVGGGRNVAFRLASTASTANAAHSPCCVRSRTCMQEKIRDLVLKAYVEYETANHKRMADDTTTPTLTSLGFRLIDLPSITDLL
jgi:hypothetical protein